MAQQSPHATAASVTTPSEGLASLDTGASRGERLPFPLAADVPWRPYVSPQRMAQATLDAEMLEAIDRRLAEVRHVEIADDQFQIDTLWLILILGAVPAVCFAVIAMVKVVGL